MPVGSEKTDRLTPAEAKARLREAVAQLGVRAWVRQRPFEAMALSLAAGLVLASSRPLRSAMMRMLVRII